MGHEQKKIIATIQYGEGFPCTEGLKEGFILPAAKKLPLP
jgi:hypothetical protein